MSEEYTEQRRESRADAAKQTLDNIDDSLRWVRWLLAAVVLVLFVQTHFITRTMWTTSDYETKAINSSASHVYQGITSSAKSIVDIILTTSDFETAAIYSTHDAILASGHANMEVVHLTMEP